MITLDQAKCNIYTIYEVSKGFIWSLHLQIFFANFSKNLTFLKICVNIKLLTGFIRLHQLFLMVGARFPPSFFGWIGLSGSNTIRMMFLRLFITVGHHWNHHTSMGFTHGFHLGFSPKGARTKPTKRA